jgi:AhpD family alkylhydroperoxidase
MEQRIEFSRVSPEPVKALLALEAYVRRSGLEHPLLHLVKLRASQLNGCGYCIDMHTKDARAAGETEQRLYCASVWRESPFYTARERAALEWTEAVTLLPDTRDVPDDVYQRVREQFSEKELVDLNFCVVAINCWNRLCVPFRVPVGSYKPGEIPKL